MQVGGKVRNQGGDPGDPAIKVACVRVGSWAQRLHDLARLDDLVNWPEQRKGQCRHFAPEGNNVWVGRRHLGVLVPIARGPAASCREPQIVLDREKVTKEHHI